MADSRWPWMRPIPGPLPFGDAADAARLGKLANTIKRRTNCDTAVDLRTCRLFFYVGEMDRSRGEPFSVLDPDGTVKIPDADEIVATINLGKVPRWLKDKWRAETEEKLKRDQMEFAESKLNERERDSVNRLQWRRNRRGMGRHFHPSVVVDGLRKGA